VDPARNTPRLTPVTHHQVDPQVDLHHVTGLGRLEMEALQEIKLRIPRRGGNRGPQVVQFGVIQRPAAIGESAGLVD